jgi:phosphinothricin tripeptide acetyl hydrolase
VVATLCALRDAGGPRVAAAALICPWTEPFASGGSMETHAAFDFGDRALLAGWAEATLGSGDASDPRFTVANADLSGLPPLLVQVGSVELLYDQVLRFAEGARKTGVDVSLEVLPEAFHDVHVQAALLPEGAAAIQAVVDYLRSRS